jgi:hypothetical protein
MIYNLTVLDFPVYCTVLVNLTVRFTPIPFFALTSTMLNVLLLSIPLKVPLRSPIVRVFDWSSHFILIVDLNPFS